MFSYTFTRTPSSATLYCYINPQSAQYFVPPSGMEISVVLDKRGFDDEIDIEDHWVDFQAYLQAVLAYYERSFTFCHNQPALRALKALRAAKSDLFVGSFYSWDMSEYSVEILPSLLRDLNGLVTLTERFLID